MKFRDFAYNDVVIPIISKNRLSISKQSSLCVMSIVFSSNNSKKERKKHILVLFTRIVVVKDSRSRNYIISQRANERDLIGLEVGMKFARVKREK